MKTSRRKFIQTSGAAAFGGMAMPFIPFDFPFGENSSEEIDIKSLFRSNREDALMLTERVFQKCILEKII